ncbi:MAG: DNA primase [Prevotellaceae bacterium]|jgi:DNA primase|nr:DNA primase [Prevotellaceae bacterium]
MIDQQTIDRINDAARIEDVVSDYVTLRKRGVNMIGLCPFHSERTPSFTVSPAKGIFKCFGCGKGGNAVNFIMEYEQLSYTEALKLLAKKYGIDVVEKELSAEELAARNDRESMLLVNEFAQKYFTNTLYHHIDGKAIGLAYFRQRGFREDIIKKFQLGFNLDLRDAFTQAALKAGYKKEYLTKTGLTIELDDHRFSDRFRGRVIFPVHSLSGKVLAFGGRILKKNEKTAKYLNSPESDIYHKSNELYGIYFAKQSIVREDRCFLVEGYTDVISMHQNGIENVVASSGTSLTSGQIRLIHRFTENITIIYDGDTAGIKASIRGIDLLLEEGMNIKVLLLPDGEDPDSFAQKHNSVDFIDFVNKNAVDFIRFKTGLLLEDAGGDPVKRAGLINDIVQSIAKIPNPIIRSEYVKECSNLLNVQESMLYHEINKIKRNELNKKTVKEHTGEADGAPPVNVGEEPSIPDISKKVFDEEEQNILRVLIRYGTETLYYVDDTAPLSVGEFIIDELEKDRLQLNEELYRFIFDEYKLQSKSAGFNPERFFLHHTNSAVSRLTADLITDKYTLSKIHSKQKKLTSDIERLVDLVPRVIVEYKNSIIIEQIKQKLLELKKADEVKDGARIDEIMQDIGRLDSIKKLLSKTLGERIILKLT